MKRQIFYFQYYKNGIKQGGCGHVRMMIQNGICRMDFYIDKVPTMNGKVKIYFYQENEKQLVGYPILEGKIEQGALQVRYECKYGDVAGGKALNDMDGIIMFDGLNLMEAIIMNLKNNEEVCVGNFTEYADISRKEEKKKAEDRIEDTEQLKKVEDDLGNTERTKKAEDDFANTVGVRKTKDDFRNTEGVETAEILSTEEVASITENVDNLDNSVYEYDEECLKKKREETMGESAACLEAESFTLHQNWQDKIFHAFPKVKVMIDGESRMGIKLRPHDMVWLPGTYWRMAKNQFLLNGYYNYRYILFFQGGDGKYYLGTPGAFGIHTAMNAKKFGFTDFFAASECNQEENRFPGQKEKGFGFWVKEVF